MMNLMNKFTQIKRTIWKAAHSNQSYQKMTKTPKQQRMNKNGRIHLIGSMANQCLQSPGNFNRSLSRLQNKNKNKSQSKIAREIKIKRRLKMTGTSKKNRRKKLSQKGNLNQEIGKESVNRDQPNKTLIINVLQLLTIRNSCSLLTIYFGSSCLSLPKITNV